ncbi:Eukaryotic translation initiation factor 3 subunit H [Papilio xuthus]|uniref:Eukaryotic translation initiation factor 3 subunit H n=1 Tax=Papilio xuthus TaxID=66420 RepID=A0A194PZV8_PAPXU|nr:Eukaryotic translation initiation factor 3 subunit H [Papilio xuthus]
MANRGGTSRRVPENEAAITYVQCDGLAVMKIVKHCHEESCSNMEVAQGALLGLVVENRLEITNCFPFPKHDDTMDEEEYQLDMMRRLRRAIAMYKDGDYTPDALRNLKIGYESLFIEVPIVIRNSPLTNIMMSELSEMIPEEEGSKF